MKHEAFIKNEAKCNLLILQHLLLFYTINSNCKNALFIFYKNNFIRTGGLFVLKT